MQATTFRHYAPALLYFHAVLCVAAAPCQEPPAGENWYERSFYLLHEDHHTSDAQEVGRDADLEETARLINLSRPDVIQIHAKGNPGWTTYPSKIGHTPPKLRRDVMQVWRDIADKYDYPFSAYFNIGRDGEIMKRRPEWNRSDARGNEIDRALCYHSGVAEQYLWPMIREITDKYRPDGWWFDGSCFTVRLCYCPQCRQRFEREYQQEPPTDPNRKDARWSAYHEMQRQIYREFVTKTAALIHEMDPECLVAVNWAYSLRMPERPDPALAYLTGDIGNRVEGLSAEAHWYDSTDVPFDLMTQLSTMHSHVVAGGTPGRRQFGPKPPVQLQQEMAIVIANGGRFWIWDNPTPESGLVAARHEYLAEHVKPWLLARRAWCLGTRRLPDASLLNAAEAHYAVTDAAGPVCFNRRDNRIDGAAELLPRLHLNYEMVGDWRLHAQDVRSGLLIVEHPKRLSRKSVDAVANFVRDGGTLLVTGMGVSSGGETMRNVLGVDKVLGPKQAERLIVEHDGQEWPFEHHLYRFQSDEAEPVILARDRKGASQPLLVRHRFGQGTAYYFATPMLTSHGANVVPPALLRTVFDQVAPSQERLIRTDAPESVEVVLRARGDDRIVHLVNMARGERQVFEAGRRKYVNLSQLPAAAACEVQLRVAARPRAVTLQPQDVPLSDWSYQDGIVRAKIPSFAVHQIVVVEAAAPKQ